MPRPREAELHRARTADGWELGLVRYPAKGTRTGPPVLLCHGIAANDRNMDLDERTSMAQWFAAQGRDAWTMSLRGSGDSDRPDASKGRAPGFSFDVYWQQDLPAAIDLVRRVSGADAVDYVGHSMGGMVLYAYLSQGGAHVHAAATMGSPTRVDWGTGVEGPLTAAAPKIEGLDFMVPSTLGAHAVAPFEPFISDGPLERFFYNPSSTTRSTWQRLVAYGTSDISSGVLRQLASLMRDGTLRSADGRLDFKADMARVTVPVLVVAAKLDRVALSPGVRDGYRALGGPKEWLLITRANGARGEYGHMDLVIGERAADEVWSKILDFFNRRARMEP